MHGCLNHHKEAKSNPGVQLVLWPDMSHRSGESNASDLYKWHLAHLVMEILFLNEPAYQVHAVCTDQMSSNSTA